MTIPPHVSLALHGHAGNQIAYTGAPRTRTRGSCARSARGSTGRVRAGEWVVERPHVIHFGANMGDRPVRILPSTLFRNGSPPSIVVPD